MRNHDAAHAVSPGESFSRLRNAQAAGSKSADADGALQHQILIVDDKPELLNSLHQLVNLHGYQADKALGGQEALPRPLLLLDEALLRPLRRLLPGHAAPVPEDCGLRREIRAPPRRAYPAVFKRVYLLYG